MNFVIFLLNFGDLSGAKDCKSCRFRKMLKNDALVAKFGVGTAENDTSKVVDRAGDRGVDRRRSTRFAILCTAQISNFH